ncbi:MAG TPA: tRNA-uridine aminocarboxypropyltransferase [Polyangiaceae bacterium]|nr:tRNA-uridine aminocarboxypropyltransferase [Polyangiaceae bacterium]
MRTRKPKSGEFIGADSSEHCPRCALNLAICVCDAVPRVVTRTEIFIIRHAAELRLASNTGRFAALCLPNARILEYAGRSVLDSAALLERADTYLLYHSGGPLTELPLARPPQRLIVLDGTFRQARRMYKRIAELRRLPELALPPPAVAPARLRQPPTREGMSTLEAIAHALSLLEGPELGKPLHDLQSELVRRFDALGGRRRVPPLPAAQAPEDPGPEVGGSSASFSSR